MVLAFWMVMELCKDTRLIKATQPNMMKIVLVDGALAGLRVLLANADIIAAQCVVGKWLAYMSFARVFGALIIKTWRVDAVVNSGFRKTPCTENHTDHTKSLSMVIPGYVLSNVRTRDKRWPSCYLLLKQRCWLAVLSCVGANDSRYRAMSMYLILIVSSVTFPIVFFQIQPVPSTLLMIMAVGFVVATVGCVVLLFGAKTLLLWEGADVNGNFAIIKQDDNGLGTSNGLVAIKDRVKSQISSGSGGRISQTTRDRPSSHGASGKNHILNNSSKGISRTGIDNKIVFKQ
eukprot:gene7551-15479_t